VPAGRLVLETDCPYVTPVPHRGKHNEPAYVGFVAEAIGELRGVPVTAIARQTVDNAVRLFGLA